MNSPRKDRRRRAPSAALLAALFLLAALTPAAPAVAGQWLVLVVDRSNSIDNRELALQRGAYARVLRDPAMAERLKDTRVAIVEFDTYSEVVTGWTTPAAAADIYERWNPPGPRGATAISRGLEDALGLLEGKRGRRIVDISGDGRDNRDSLGLARLRKAATLDGVEINGLVFGRQRKSLESYYGSKVANGFVMGVDSLAHFEDALRRKLNQEVFVSRLERGPAPDRLIR